jgi:hypothetical protein
MRILPRLAPGAPSGHAPLLRGVPRAVLNYQRLPISLAAWRIGRDIAAALEALAKATPAKAP